MFENLFNFFFSFPCKPLKIVYNSCVRVFPSDWKIAYVPVTRKVIAKTYIMTGKFLFFSVLCKSGLKLIKKYHDRVSARSGKPGKSEKNQGIWISRKMSGKNQGSL